MATNEHTPGPWRVDGGDVRWDGSVIQDGGIVARVTDPAHPTAKADARLIAAAPALLDACRAALRHLEDPCDYLGTPQVRDALRSALSLAEGREVTP